MDELQRPCYRKIVKVYWFYVKILPNLDHADFSRAKAKAGIRFYACDFPGCSADRTWHFKDPLETHMLECHAHDISGERLPNGMANFWEYVPLHPVYFGPVGNRRGEKLFTREILFNLTPSPSQRPRGITEEEHYERNYEEVSSDEETDTDEEISSAQAVGGPKRSDLKDREENSREEWTSRQPRSFTPGMKSTTTNFSLDKIMFE
ncbi:hypothetical protein R1sor_024473 [Riccia sorocarpa]|uniref:C2H2-type domain-containing protein n=1 Tax=Riccia sorocarpa TaxID=122646 RepID=A0ABD3GTL5_9MARC